MAMLFVLIRVLTVQGLPFIARRTYRQQPNLRHRWRVALSEAGIRAITPNQDAYVSWRDFVAWSENAKVLLLYQGDRLFQFIPRRAIDGTFLAVAHRMVAHLPRR